MDIYTEKNTLTDSVEVVVNCQELKKIKDALVEFEMRVRKFKKENANQKNLGYTHLHLQDCGISGADIVFYVNL